MKKERKEALLNSFPALPEQFRIKMQGKYAANFVVFLTYGNELFARCYHRYSKGDIVERQRYVFAKDGCVRYGVDFRGKWSIRSEFREPVFCSTAYGYSFDNSYSVINIEAIKQSCMRYSMADKFKNRLIIEYLRIYCKHPNIEYLIKAGYDVISETVTGYWGGRTLLSVSPEINWKSNNLLKMLNLNRTEFAVLKNNEHYYESYINYREKFPKMKPVDLLSVAKVFGYETGTLQRFCNVTGLKPQRIARYLSEKQIRKYDYSDYIEQCQELKYDMRDTAISMPHDFRRMHERLSELVEIKINDDNKASFKTNYPERKRLEFRFGNLIIRQPDSMEEIADEGKILHHCVGGYAERHANGKLHIMFIRTMDKPDVPFYTMEVSKDGKIVQVRGIRNCDPTPEVAELVQMYEEYLSITFERKVRISA